MNAYTRRYFRLVLRNDWWEVKMYNITLQRLLQTEWLLISFWNNWVLSVFKNPTRHGQMLSQVETTYISQKPAAEFSICIGSHFTRSKGFSGWHAWKISLMLMSRGTVVPAYNSDKELWENNKIGCGLGGLSSRNECIQILTPPTRKFLLLSLLWWLLLKQHNMEVVEIWTTIEIFNFKQ
jgi:hypothetical protein